MLFDKVAVPLCRVYTLHLYAANMADEGCKVTLLRKASKIAGALPIFPASPIQFIKAKPIRQAKPVAEFGLTFGGVCLSDTTQGTCILIIAWNRSLGRYWRAKALQ